MGTTAEKLQAIVQAKADIGAAITEKGGTVPEKLSEYGNAIRALPSGAAPLGEPLDAQKVYAALRDTSWPPMPQDIPDHTVVMLLAPESSVAFFVTCEGQYTVTVQQCVLTDGQWTYTEELTESWDSDIGFSRTYTEADGSNYRLLTVSGNGITEFNILNPSGSTSLMPGVLELIFCLPSAGFPCLRKMQDLVWVTALAKEDQEMAGTGNAFDSCKSLVAIMAPNIVYTGLAVRQFAGCESLIAIDMQSTVTKYTNYNTAFLGCKMLTSIPISLFKNLGSASNAFVGCRSLRRVSIFGKENKNTGLFNAFAGCVSLEEVRISGAIRPAQMNRIFDKCISLRSLIFDVPNWTGQSFSIANCAFQRSGLVEMFQSLPTIATPRNITITGNPGVAELTDADKAIATDKGWTLTL